MMRTINIIIAIFIFQTSFAQNKYEIGIEGGLTSVYYNLKDNKNNLQSLRLLSAMQGLNFRINTTKRFYYEIAATAMQYTHGLKLKQQEAYFTSNADDVIMFPFRVGYSYKLNNHFALVPVIGFAPVIKTSSADGSSGSYEERNSTSFSKYEFEARELGKDLFMLAQGGFALEYINFKKFKIAMGANYYQGLSNQTIYDIKYSINNEPVQSAIMYGRGSFLHYSLSLKYTFPNNKQLAP